MYSSELLLNFYRNFKGVFTLEYLESSTNLSIIIGVIGAVMIIVSAFLLKRCRVLGVFAGILQIGYSYCSQKFAHLIHTMDFFRVETFHGDSQSDLDNQLDEFYSSFYKDYLMDTIALIIYSLVLTAAFVLTLIFIIKCLSIKPKGLFVTALALFIVRTLFVPPYDVITPFISVINDTTQTKVDGFFYFATLLPLFFLLLGAIISKFIKKPQQNAAPAITSAE